MLASTLPYLAVLKVMLYKKKNNSVSLEELHELSGKILRIMPMDKGVFHSNARINKKHGIYFKIRQKNKMML